MKEKLKKVVEQGYMEPGFVKNLTGYFPVPKGDQDIRMVYDATKSGLNEAVWAPNFFVPSIDTVLQSMCNSTWSGDIDLGEMFLNYHVDCGVRSYMGVDLTQVFDKDKMLKFRDKKGRLWWFWSRCMMGFKPSPFLTTRAFAWSEDIIFGDPSDLFNPLGWDRVILNLPGMKNFDPKMPSVYKWSDTKQAIAATVKAYIDDLRSLGKDREECNAVIHRVASRANYLGQQDAPRKRRPPSQTPGL